MNGSIYNNRRGGRRNPMVRRTNGSMRHNHNQTYDSNGPGVRVKGTAQQIYDKYTQLARDTMGLDDRVLVENYLQHAEHYYRLAFPEGLDHRPTSQGNEFEPTSSASLNAYDQDDPQLEDVVTADLAQAEAHPQAQLKPIVEIYSDPCQADEVEAENFEAARVRQADDQQFANQPTQGELSLARQLTLRSRNHDNEDDRQGEPPRLRQPRRFAINRPSSASSAVGPAVASSSHQNSDDKDQPAADYSDSSASFQGGYDQANRGSDNATDEQTNQGQYRQRRSWRNPSGRPITRGTSRPVGRPRRTDTDPSL